MTSPGGKINAPRNPPYKWAGVASAGGRGGASCVLVYGQFRGDFTPKTKLTMVASRAGLVMDPGSKVTYNGVEIGRVAHISEVVRDGKPAAKFTPGRVSAVPQADSGECERRYQGDHGVRR